MSPLHQNQVADLCAETLARWVGNYLTKSSGIKVVFESAIVPKWKDGVITFKNVFVSRRPGQARAKVTKGSPTTAQAAAAAAAAVTGSASSAGVSEDEDLNYSQFELSLDTVNVTLSFAKWFNGKGLLKDMEVKGVRGVLDRTSVHWNEHFADPQSYRHEHNTGDFELESFRMEDLLISVHQPGNFRPFSVSVFSADLPRLRKQWLFYDFLSANHVSGSFDNSAFFIHPRQTHTLAIAHTIQDPEDTKWKKQSRIRVDGLNIDHLNTGVEGPFSWIHEGDVDILADVMFPLDDDESIAKVMSDFYDRVEATVVANNRFVHTHPQPDQDDKESTMNQQSIRASHQAHQDDRFLIMDLHLQLNDVRGSIPLLTRDLSYVNNALIRPIVAYINNHRNRHFGGGTFIPVNCRVVKHLREFDGSWTMYDSGLMDAMSKETYDAFARDVVDDQARMRRIKKVGLWSLQLAIQALFLGLAGNIA